MLCRPLRPRHAMMHRDLSRGGRCSRGQALLRRPRSEADECPPPDERWRARLCSQDSFGPLLALDAVDSPCRSPSSPRSAGSPPLPAASSSQLRHRRIGPRRRSRFGVNGIDVGLFCSTPMIALSRTSARRRRLDMLMTGETIDAGRGLAAGLVRPRWLPARRSLSCQGVSKRDGRALSDVARPANVLALGKRSLLRAAPPAVCRGPYSLGLRLTHPSTTC